jgi:hypothetical protein
MATSNKSGRPKPVDAWGGAPLNMTTLRKLWKPRRDAYSKAHLYEEVRVRIHRALTWLEFSERCDVREDLDAKLIAQWIAFTALTSQWNKKTKAPEPDAAATRLFIQQILDHDQDGLMQMVLETNDRAARALFEDAYLAKQFKSRETAQNSKPRNGSGKTFTTKSTMEDILEHAQFEPWLEAVLERILFVRNQLVHGGSTYNGRLNRVAVRRASSLLEHVVACFMQILMEHGYTDDWGDLCYSPLVD